MRPLVFATSLVVLVAGERFVGAAEPRPTDGAGRTANADRPVVAGGIVLRWVPSARSDTIRALDPRTRPRDRQVLLVLSHKNRLRQQADLKRPAQDGRRPPSRWTFPMGRIGILSGETPEIAALREVREETGLRGLLPLGEVGRYPVKRRGVRVFYWLGPARPRPLDREGRWTPRLTAGFEIAQCEWVPCSDAVDELAPPDARVLAALLTRLDSSDYGLGER